MSSVHTASTQDASKEETPRDNPSDNIIWQTYLKAAEDHDEARLQNWEGSTNGILTFTGLFAATVATFIVESYSLLSPDPRDRTNALLEQLLIAMANTSSSKPIIIPPSEPFSAPPTAVVINVFWFLSLLISLICALLSTLVQEWSRAYAHDIKRRKVLHEDLKARVFNHIFIRMGVDRYGKDQFVSWIVALVHLSVFLFACGLAVFLYSINSTVAGISTALLGAFLVLYWAASLVPLLDKSCPYRTPASYMTAAAYWLVLQTRIFHPTLWRGEEFKNRFHDLVARHYPARSFMTLDRFDFLWKHTYIHIPKDSETLGKLVKGLIGLIAAFQEGRTLLLSRLCANEELMQSLKWYLSSMIRDSSYVHLDSSIFELVTLLSEGMYAQEVTHHGGHIVDNLRTNSFLLHVIGEISRIAELEGPPRHLARVCLARVRWSLLKLCQTSFEKNVPTIKDEELPAFVREASRYGFQLNDRHPSGVLLILITGSYDGNKWTHRDEFTLLPVHDDGCCKDWRSALTPEGLTHVIACNALSTVAHILEPTDSPRDSVEGVLKGFFDRNQPWNVTLEKLETSRQKTASAQFVSVLQSAGLNEWLKAGSKFNTGPRGDGALQEYLRTAHLGGPHCIHLLGDLAERVDFAAYHGQIPQTYGVTHCSEVCAEVLYEVSTPSAIEGASTMPTLLAPDERDADESTLQSDSMELKSVLVCGDCSLRARSNNTVVVDVGMVEVDQGHSSAILRG